MGTDSPRVPGAVAAGDVLTRVNVGPEGLQDVVAAEAVAALDRIDPADGSMVQAVWFDAQPPVLMLCVHHLATDVVSWYVVLGALMQLAVEIEAGATPGRPANTPPTGSGPHCSHNEAAQRKSPDNVTTGSGS